MNKLTSFTVDDRPVPVVFVETMDVKEGVVCDVYKIEGDDTRDLAIVTVRKGCKTPASRPCSSIYSRAKRKRPMR